MFLANINLLEIHQLGNNRGELPCLFNSQSLNSTFPIRLSFSLLNSSTGALIKVNEVRISWAVLVKNRTFSSVCSCFSRLM